jgi:hypothetical protein
MRETAAELRGYLVNSRITGQQKLGTTFRPGAVK